MDLTKLYCNIDDFWKSFKQEWDKHLISKDKAKKGPDPKLSTSEMMTIVILFRSLTIGLLSIFTNTFPSIYSRLNLNFYHLNLRESSRHSTIET